MQNITLDKTGVERLAAAIVIDAISAAILGHSDPDAGDPVEARDFLRNSPIAELCFEAIDLERSRVIALIDSPGEISTEGLQELINYNRRV